MPHPPKDPVDHARTTRQHAGETMKDGSNAPGLVAIALAVIAVCAALYAFATGHALPGVIVAVVAVVVGGAGSASLAAAHRRVRDAERRWHSEHPSAPAEPPTS